MFQASDQGLPLAKGTMSDFSFWVAPCLINLHRIAVPQDKEKNSYKIELDSGMYLNKQRQAKKKPTNCKF